ncbi:MAG: tRNA (uridine(54)-C5)-methyltransferase TrmA [Azoarcus sp.]|jgi:tRNA (uracil-5-)-methyltransferase|nr:tRNA (uridine(54)-C5)-methyltransferase TrmA [Azoarcus sp.]
MPLSRIDPERYFTLFAAKAERVRRDFAAAALALPELQLFASPPLGYRLRAEFRIWHTDTSIDYAMFGPADPRRAIPITDFPPAVRAIRTLMPLLRARLTDETLRHRLFQVEFLATLKGEMLVSLIYHRPLDDAWEAAARALAADLGVQMIGRSRGQKIVIGRDWLEEEIRVDGRRLRYRQIEGGFSQPNGEVNRAMLGWTRARAAGLGGDLLELYCGNGNFTVALAPLFDKVFATELSKPSVAAAHCNLEANGASNVTLARMASDEVGAALARVRTFRRLKDIDLDAYRFTTLFVDPPRAGLDAATLELARGFANVLYVSCNPATLLANASALAGSHRITAAAAFDQFPYTGHLECGLLLEQRSPAPAQGIVARVPRTLAAGSGA